MWTAPLPFESLSEGEQQLLMVLGLLRFTQEDEALFLLDEPDTHLNPAWSQRYLELLKEVGGMTGSSHVVMATHDPLVVSSLKKEQVRISSRDEETGEISAEQPRDDPRGMGVAGLLTSDIYGLRSQLDVYTLDLIERQRELSAREELDTVDAAILRDLTEHVRRLGFTRETRDPDFKLFRNAIAEWRRDEGWEAQARYRRSRSREAEPPGILRKLKASDTIR